MKCTPEVTPEIVREFFDYNQDSGELTWKPRSLKWFTSELSMKRDNSKRAGKRAGRVSVCRKSGYQSREVKVLGKDCAEHRVIWMWMTGKPAPEAIDHINQDGTDNRWQNLAPSSWQENNRNCSLKKSNTSGVTGVSWNKSMGKWVANVTINYKLIRVGVFDDIGEAESAVNSFRLGHGFSALHGQSKAPYKN